MLKVEFLDEVEVINYQSKKTGRPGTITKTTGYIHGIGKYPEKFKYVSFDGEVKKAGMYEAKPVIRVEDEKLITEYEFVPIVAK